LTAVLCAALLVASSPRLAAQDAPAPAPTPPGPSDTASTPTLLEYEGQAVTVSVGDVMKSALEKNLNITLHSYDPKISESLIDTQWAAFSPVLNFDAYQTQNTEPSSSQLAGGLAVTTKNTFASGTYTDFFTIGGRLDFTVFNNRTTTNNTFATVNPSYFSQALATYTQHFLRGFGVAVNKAGIVIAQNNDKISRSQFRQTVMQTISDAEKAYWQLQFAIMDQKANEASLKLAQDFLDQTRIKVKVGTLPPIEITQAEAQVANQEVTLITGLEAIRLAEDNLRRLMNIPTGSPMWHQPIQPADEPQVVEKVVNEDEALKTAMDKRPDLEQARLDLSNKDTTLAFDKNQKLYRLDFIGKYGASGLAGTFLPVQFSTGAPGTPPGCVPNPGNPAFCTFTPPPEGIGTSFTQIKNRDFDTWTAELQLGIPIGNKAADAAYAQAKFQQDQSKLNIQILEQNATLEVRNAVRQVEADLKRVKAAKVNTRLQEEKLSAEQKKYENGMSTAFQVLSFQTDLTTARRSENLAIVSYNIDLVELDRVLGILLDTRNITVTN
jgi:outer membrane protein TolC